MVRDRSSRLAEVTPTGRKQRIQQGSVQPGNPAPSLSLADALGAGLPVLSRRRPKVSPSVSFLDVVEDSFLLRLRMLGTVRCLLQSTDALWEMVGLARAGFDV